MNTPVSFPLAKLLKEKEFNNNTLHFYTKPNSKMFGIDEHGRYYAIKNKAKSLWIAGKVAALNIENVYQAPTIADVVMWLYEKHEIWISVDWMSRTKPYNSGFYCHLRGTNKNLNQDNFVSINNTKEPGYEVFNSPTEAYEAGIFYTLNNLK